MAVNAAMFLFLAAATVALFAFLSIAVWVTTPSNERQARDRLALLKTLAEQPGENAARVLEMLREEDERRIERKEREELRGWIDGGLIVMAVGFGLSLMLALLGTRGAWPVGLIPFLVGCALFGVGLLRNRAASRRRKEVK
jgi:Flp pilus assembly protein TadB